MEPVKYLKVKAKRGGGFWLLAEQDFDPAKWELYNQPQPEPPKPVAVEKPEPEKEAEPAAERPRRARGIPFRRPNTAWTDKPEE
jgi:hypothetical protein